jgi:putative membrane protein
MIRRIILAIIANSVALYLVDYFLTGICFVSEIVTSCPAQPESNIIIFAIAGIVLGLLNTFVKPLLKLISMPITFLTAGLFMFVINGFVFGLLVWLINTLNLQTMQVFIFGDNTWITYLYAAIILGLFNISTHWLIRK